MGQIPQPLLYSVLMIRVDPIDQTLLTYMDNGEVIPCDIVVLKDDKGNKIFIT